MARMDITHKFAQQAIDAFHREDFQPGVVAGILVNAGPMIRVKAFKLALHIFDKLALRLQSGEVGSNDDYRACITAARVVDSVDWDFAP